MLSSLGSVLSIAIVCLHAPVTVFSFSSLHSKHLSYRARSNDQGISMPTTSLPYYNSYYQKINQQLPKIKTPLWRRYAKGGRRGKSASSPEEDLELTIDAILNHLDREESQRKEEVAEREKEEIGTLPSNQSSSTTSTSKLDDILSGLTSCFPLFVASAASIGYKFPSTLTWVNRGQLIPFMLASVMLAMGMTLTKSDFTRVLNINNNENESNTSTPTSSFSAIPIGIACQYMIMPITAFLIGKSLLLPSYPSAFLGLLLVGSCPGGTASNLVSLIARADVALSVILTSISTILASILTPLWVRFLVGTKSINVSGWLLCKATARVVLIPVALGMILREKTPKLADTVGRYTSFLGVVLVSLLCGGVVAQNSAMMASSGASIMGPLTKILFGVIGLHTVGFLVGFGAPYYLGKLSEKEARTISIETGMQNSALAVVLARTCMMNSGASDITASMISLACLPGALSATIHSCLGSALAVYWRWKDNRKKKGAN